MSFSLGLELWTVAIFRIIACGSLFLLHLQRHPYIEEMYTNVGFLPREVLGQFIPENYQPLFNWYFWADSLMPQAHLLLLVLLLLLTLGVGGRKICWLAFILHAAFNQRNMMVMYGADVVGTLWLFYLSFCHSNAYLNFGSYLRRWLMKKKNSFLTDSENKDPVYSDLFTSAGIRLLQIQLCVIYAFSGFEKLKGGGWLDGTGIWLLIGSPEMRAMNLDFLLQAPLLMAAVGFFTVIFEVYFPFAIWLRQFRPWWMIAGFVLHVGVALTMGLYFFSALMIAAYVFFLSGLVTQAGDNRFSNSYAVTGR